jgi:hypothetical protein|tara:strand:+ start:481 stop:849 length:369 start_codon:yes stop_codon:yes gene_type:complete
MGLCVCTGAKAKCSMGDNEVQLTSLPVPNKGEGNPLMSVLDSVPYLNIPSFGQCKSPANPMVIASYGAPQTCIPVTITPWSPGAKQTKVLGNAALLDKDTNMCMWAGSIEITDPGQTSIKAT